MLLATEEEVCILWNMSYEIKSIVFKIKILRDCITIFNLYQIVALKLFHVQFSLVLVA